MADLDYTRLHITPLTPTLLQTYLPASMQGKARNISYHEIQTFPENNYGFVELPQKDAERIRKKFHGSIIKSAKVRVEVARPIQYRDPKPSPSTPPVSIKRRELTSKRKINELLGVDIGKRHVKRGWTVPVFELKKLDLKNKAKFSSKFVVKSKFTPGPECLFKAVLPANLTTLAPQIAQAIKNKRKRNTREILIHEFSNTKKYATFLKTSNEDATMGSSKHIVAKYVEGEGWFDQQNNIVEKFVPGAAKKSIISLDRKNIKKIEENHPTQADEELIIELPLTLSSSKKDFENKIERFSLNEVIDELHT